MNPSNNPKAFISHASEDKLRFVDNFALALPKIGIDPWYDKWEIKAGDSLVAKIFDEGVEDAEVFFIVLSKYSVAKPWVKEESDAAVNKLINEGCKVIPIVLDDCTIPRVFRHRKWITIKDPKCLDPVLEEIKHAVFDVELKPKPETAPRFSKLEVVTIDPELSGIDTLLLVELCEKYLSEGGRLINPDDLIQRLSEHDITEIQINESFEALEENYHVELHKVLGGGIYSVTLSTSAIDDYLKCYMENYEEVELSITSLIVNEELRTTSEICEKTGFSHSIVNHFLQNFTDLGLVESTMFYGSNIQIFKVSTKLRRSLNKPN